MLFRSFADRRKVVELFDILLAGMHWTTMPLLDFTSEIGPLDGIGGSLVKLQIGSEASRLRAID